MSFDISKLILWNCRYLFKSDGPFNLITRRQPDGFFSVTVVKERGHIEPCLTGAGSSPLEALRDLFWKTTAATPKAMPKDNNRADRNLEYSARVSPDAEQDFSDDESVFSDSGSSTHTVSLSNSDSSDYSCQSDDETVSISGGTGKELETDQKRGEAEKREIRDNPTQWNRPRELESEGARSSSADVDPNPNLVRLRGPLPQPMCPRPTPVIMRPHNLASAPLRQPQQPNNGGWNPATIRGYYPPERPGRVVAHPPPMFQKNPYPAPQQQQQGYQQRLCDVRIHVRWHGHGDQRILTQAEPSLRAIRMLALDWVRRNPCAFKGVTTREAVPSNLMLLQATVLRARIDEEDYDMTTYKGDDLTTLIEHASRNGIPKFDVDVVAGFRPPYPRAPPV